LNKVDLPSANPEEVSDDIIDLLGCKLEDIIHASGKTGFGVENILAAIEKIPPPSGGGRAFTSFDFDSHYNPFRGIEVIFRVKNGQIKKAKKLNLWLIIC
jgi:GTP-binding protein LepA